MSGLSPEDEAMVDNAAWEHTVAMWQDLIELCALQIVHGPEAGYRRFRYLRFGTPEGVPIPPGVDVSKISMPPGWGGRT